MIGPGVMSSAQPIKLASAWPHAVTRNSLRVAPLRVATTDRAIGVPDDSTFDGTQDLIPLKDLPTLEGLPIVGMGMEFMEDFETLGKYFEKFGEHFVLNMGVFGGYTLVTRNADEIREVIETRNDEFKLWWPSPLAKLVWPEPRVATDEEALPWKRALQPSLHSRAVLSQHLPLMVANAKKIVPTWATGKDLLLRKEVQVLSFKNIMDGIIGDCLTDEELQYLLPITRVRDHAHNASDYGFLRGMPGTQYHKAIQARDQLREFFASKVESMMQDRENIDRDGSIIGLFLGMLEKEGVVTPSTPNREIGEMMAGWIDLVQVAAADGPGFTITRTMMWLNKHPEWLQALGEEQDRLVAEFGDNITPQMLSKAKVTAAIINETMRLTSPFSVIQRNTTKDTHLGGVSLPAGSKVMLAIGQACRQTGNASATFDPAQWLSEDSEYAQTNNDKGNVAFSSGVRKCPGADSAMVQSLVTLSVIGRHVAAVETSPEERDRMYHAMAWPTEVPARLIPRQH